MNREEFMNQLERLLFDLPADEREEALRYYQDYFDDAGKDEESRIVEELGTPEKVAKLIKGNLYNKAASEAGEYTENGYYNPYDEQTKDSNSVVNYGSTTQNNNNYQEKPIDKDRTKTVLIIALVILSFPLWIGAAGAIFGLSIGAIATLFGLTVAFGGSCLALLISGVVTLVVGIGQLFVSTPTGLVMIGISLLCIAFGMFFLVLTVLLVGRAIPAIIRGITSLLSRLFNKGRRVVA